MQICSSVQKEESAMGVRTNVPYSGNGGLTLVPLPGFEEIAKTLKEGIERKGNSTNKTTG